jgi:hypothetical protein
MQENAGVQVSERPEAKERGAGVASGHKDSVVCGCLSATPIVIGVRWPPPCAHQTCWSLQFVSSTSSHTRPDPRAEYPKMRGGAFEG